MAHSFWPTKEVVLDLNVARAVARAVWPNSVELELAVNREGEAFYAAPDPSAW
jgi:hypothetical protein